MRAKRSDRPTRPASGAKKRPGSAGLRRRRPASAVARSGARAPAAAGSGPGLGARVQGSLQGDFAVRSGGTALPQDVEGLREMVWQLKSQLHLSETQLHALRVRLQRSQNESIRRERDLEHRLDGRGVANAGDASGPVAHAAGRAPDQPGAQPGEVAREATAARHAAAGDGAGASGSFMAGMAGPPQMPPAAALPSRPLRASEMSGMDALSAARADSRKIRALREQLAEADRAMRQREAEMERALRGQAATHHRELEERIAEYAAECGRLRTALEAESAHKRRLARALDELGGASAQQMLRALRAAQEEAASLRAQVRGEEGDAKRAAVLEQRVAVLEEDVAARDERLAHLREALQRHKSSARQAQPRAGGEPAPAPSSAAAAGGPSRRTNGRRRRRQEHTRAERSELQSRRGGGGGGEGTERSSQPAGAEQGAELGAAVEWADEEEGEAAAGQALDHSGFGLGGEEGEGAATATATAEPQETEAALGVAPHIAANGLPLEAGTAVEARFRGAGGAPVFPGVVHALRAAGRVHIAYDDGDEDPDLPCGAVTALVPGEGSPTAGSTGTCAGDRIMAQARGEEGFSPGRIRAVHADGSVDVRFQHGSLGEALPAGSVRSMASMRGPQDGGGARWTGPSRGGGGDEETVAAAARIQAHYRGHATRRRLSALPSPSTSDESYSDGSPQEADDDAEEEENAAAARIQAAQRGRRARREVAEQRERENAAAARIQAAQRGRRARREVAEQRERENAAAARIQAAQRGRRARREVAEQRERENTAAARIQAVQRGSMVRRQRRLHQRHQKAVLERRESHTTGLEALSFDTLRLLRALEGPSLRRVRDECETLDEVGSGHMDVREVAHQLAKEQGADQWDEGRAEELLDAFPAPADDEVDYTALFDDLAHWLQAGEPAVGGSALAPTEEGEGGEEEDEDDDEEGYSDDFGRDEDLGVVADEGGEDSEDDAFERAIEGAVLHHEQSAASEPSLPGQAARAGSGGDAGEGEGEGGADPASAPWGRHGAATRFAARPESATRRRPSSASRRGASAGHGSQTSLSPDAVPPQPLVAEGGAGVEVEAQAEAAAGDEGAQHSWRWDRGHVLASGDHIPAAVLRASGLDADKDGDEGEGDAFLPPPHSRQGGGAARGGRRHGGRIDADAEGGIEALSEEDDAEAYEDEGFEGSGDEA